MTLQELVRKHSIEIMKKQQEKRAALRKELQAANLEMNND